MDILPRERAIESFPQLAEYVERHRGHVHGSMWTRPDEEWEGTFEKVEPADSSNELVIRFVPSSEADALPHDISQSNFGEIQADKFATNAISVYSRHKL